MADGIEADVGASEPAGLLRAQQTSGIVKNAIASFMASGLASNFYRGLDGAAGPPGVDGVSGDRGPAGEKGDKGDAGSSGDLMNPIFLALQPSAGVAAAKLVGGTSTTLPDSAYPVSVSGFVSHQALFDDVGQSILIAEPGLYEICYRLLVSQSSTAVLTGRLVLVVERGGARQYNPDDSAAISIGGAPAYKACEVALSVIKELQSGDRVSFCGISQNYAQPGAVNRIQVKTSVRKAGST